LLELNNSAQNQTHRLNVLFAYRYWRDVDREFQTMSMDIPRQRQFPGVPVTDNRLVQPQRQFNPLNGGSLEDNPGSDLPISA
jgi:hypothetical protein